MRKLFVILVATSSLTSCFDPVNHQERIILRNNTKFKLKVELFPSVKYGYGHFYTFSDGGSGTKDTRFVIDSTSNANTTEIFASADLSKSPNDLALAVFDSITVTVNNPKQTLIKFRKDSATNYTQNLFAKDLKWVYEKNEFNLPTMFKRHPVESNDYYFVIEYKNILKE